MHFPVAASSSKPVFCALIACIGLASAPSAAQLAEHEPTVAAPRLAPSSETVTHPEAANGAARSAPARLSRGGAIAQALRQNPQLAAARAVEAQSRARGDQADAARFPTITLLAGFGPSLQASLQPGTAVQSTENSYGDVGLRDLSVVLGGQLEVLQPLYTFGKISHRQDAAAHELRALQAQSQMTSAEVAFEVARLYESWLFARDLTLFFDDTLHWLGRAVDSTDEQIERGSGATEQDKLRIQAATGAVQIGFHQADAGRRQAEGGLVAYLALPPGTTLQPVEERFEALKFEPVNEHTLGGLALQKRPEITALAAGAQAYRALGDAEQADDLPDFFALAFASGAFTPGRDLIDTRFVVDPLNHFVPGALLGARWKWGTGGMASARAEENYAKARELQQTRRWAEHGFPAQVKKALEDVRRASLDIRSAEVAVQQSKSWTVRASADYAIGFGDSRDVADSSTAFVRLRVAYLEAILRHNIALAELAKATGTLKASDSPFYPTKE